MLHFMVTPNSDVSVPTVKINTWDVLPISQNKFDHVDWNRYVLNVHINGNDNAIYKFATNAGTVVIYYALEYST